MTFTADVRNLGLAAAAPTTMTFAIDTVVVDSQSTPALGVGASAQVVGSWVATVGLHDLLVTADGPDAIAEFDEGNNQATASFTVSAGQPDPGAPFEDTNDDGLYEDGVDNLLPLSAVSDGIHDAGPYGLVIPPSVGALSASAWDIDGAGTHRIHVDLTATAGTLDVSGGGLVTATRLEASGVIYLTTGTTSLAGATLDGASIDADTGSLDLTGATLTTTGATDVVSTGGIIGDGLVAQAGGYLRLRAETDLGLDQAIVAAGTNGAGNLWLTAVTGSWQADFAQIEAPGTITATATTLDLVDATVTAQTAIRTISTNGADVQRTTFQSPSTTFEADDEADTHNVQDACFLDAAGDPSSPALEPATLDTVGTPACGTIPVLDPGFPFEDTNGDGSYTEGVDVALDPADVQDGDHDAGNDGLIIPASVGPIAAHDIRFKAGDDSYIGVDLTAVQGHIDIDIDGELIMDGVTITTEGNNKKFEVDHEGFSGVGMTVRSRGPVTIDGGATDLTGADLETLTNGDTFKVIVDTGDLVADGARFYGRGPIDLQSADDLSLVGADLETATNGDEIKLDAGGDLLLEDAVIDTRGPFKPKADEDVELDGMTLNMLTNGAEFTVDAGEWLFANGADIEARGDITWTADNVRAEDLIVVMLTNAEDFIIDSNGLIDLDRADLTGFGHFEFTAVGDIGLDGAQITGLTNTKDLRATAGGFIDVENSVLNVKDDIVLDTGSLVYVQDATFIDQNDRADIVPNGASSGTPASGGLE